MKKDNKIFWLLVILFWLWFFVSFVDINIHNLTEEHYLKYNFFDLFFNRGLM